MVRTEKVESVAEFLEVVCALRDGWNVEDGRYSDPWFRGHRDAKWELAPNIFRLKLGDEECDIRDSYQRMGVQLMTERLPTDEWSWYFVMQHYGAPTRLLDWTDGALIALLFAVTPARAGEPKVDTDAAVWVLDPWWLNQQVIQQDTIVSPSADEATRYLPKLNVRNVEPEWPIAIDPPHIARRIAVQRSHFTIFGRRPDGLTSMSRRPDSRLVKLVVRRRAIERIRLDLGTAGVGETTVFPDLDGLSRELTRFWSESWQMEAPMRRRARPATRSTGRSRRRT
ncbi:MAG TPA: FRG domain-containing protein [Thermoanaerobaculia bacterium]|nr:FRG domain-containing protein [Thermoanaerobaculia bacterium]